MEHKWQDPEVEEFRDDMMKMEGMKQDIDRLIEMTKDRSCFKCYHFPGTNIRECPLCREVKGIMERYGVSPND